MTVSHRLPEDRMHIVRTRNFALDTVERGKNLAYRLAKCIRTVLHARRLRWVAAIPRIGATQPAVIDTAHAEESQGEYRHDHQQKHERAVACLRARGRR